MMHSFQPSSRPAYASRFDSTQIISPPVRREIELRFGGARLCVNQAGEVEFEPANSGGALRTVFERFTTTPSVRFPGAFTVGLALHESSLLGSRRYLVDLVKFELMPEGTDSRLFDVVAMQSADLTEMIFTRVLSTRNYRIEVKFGDGPPVKPPPRGKTYEPNKRLDEPFGEVDWREPGTVSGAVEEVPELAGASFNLGTHPVPVR